MRNIYIAVALFFFLSIFLFISSFFYLDRVKHQTLYYTINYNGINVGTIKIDKYDTEDKLIYKAVSNTPFYPTWTESRTRIFLNRKYELESFLEENSAGGAIDMACIEKSDSSVSFVAKYLSSFIYLRTIPVKKGTFVFNVNSILTYLPIIENYNFRRGRSQGFNGLTYFDGSLLPPMKRFITLTSTKDEYIKIGKRKIKTENLLLKIKNYAPGSVWVAKSDKSIIKIELPKMGIRITRAFSSKIPEIKEYVAENPDYLSKNISFKSGNVQLSGTATYPAKDGRYPAVVLAGGDGPQDRQYQGFFSSIADYLSRNGFYVLRFDRRGVGSSGGDSQSTSLSDEVGDITAALEYVSTLKEVDLNKISIISHSKGTIYAIKVAAENRLVKALVLMSPMAHIGLGDEGRIAEIQALGLKRNWSEDYLLLVARSIEDTKNKINKYRSSWASILGKRCFLKNQREEMDEVPVEVIKKVKIPVLILQGKEDEESYVESASNLDKALEESGNPAHSLTYYGYLGHFFGNKINDGFRRIHYSVDDKVLENIKSWLTNIPV